MAATRVRSSTSSPTRWARGTSCTSSSSCSTISEAIALILSRRSAAKDLTTTPPATCAGGVFCVPFRLPTRALPRRSQSRCTNQSMLTILLLLALHAPEDSVLKARYIAVEGTDAEAGQGAIRRNELLPHPLPRLVWLILADLTPTELQSKLNAAVDP